ncbi:MAG: T9SS type A sorting domain-containing protein [Salinivirgaceae bacterium]|nr:T9SS type A sorting domain-containing protein [Salinivirgaceae bacterium]
MKKQLLSMATVLALFSTSFAQTTNYLDFEGTLPTSGTFGGSDLSIVANPSATGINTSANVAKTQKAETGSSWWGGAYFPCGGTVDFTPTEQTFSIDVYCEAVGEVMCKVEQGAQGAVEIHGNYTTAGQWQTVTFDMSSSATGVLNGDYKQLVVFMGIDTTATGVLNYNVWYYDNVKGPDFTAGASVDPNVTITDYTGTAASVAIAFSSAPDTKIALDGAQGLNAIWTKDITGVTGSTIFAPVTYTIYVNDAAYEGMTDIAFSMAGSTGVKIALNIGSPAADVNLINNGTFDDIEGVMIGRTGTEWGMWTDNGGVAEVKDGVVNITPVTDGDNWAMQLEQWNFPTLNEHQYEIKFEAWADADRLICLTIEDPANSYAPIGASDDDGAYDGRSKWDINITAEQTEYELTMLVDGMLANSTPKFAFLLAQSDEMVYIDNVSLKDITIGVPSKQASSLNIYPNPATNVAYVNTQVGTLINVYSITGKLMMSKVAANEVESIDVANLATGIYMVKVAEKAVRLVVK